jgi:CubicO group peptidase (beta-lactamase class C family)
MSIRRLLVIPALASALASGAQSQSVAPPDIAAFDRYVAKAARDWNVPGMADELVFAKGYGVIEIGKPAPANEHTRFAIGSTTKAMTSMALAMLVDEGKVHFDDHVSLYLPELQLYDPYVTRELTIRDLLTHRTGLPGADAFWSRWTTTTPEIIRRLRYLKPTASFRAKWQYNNVLYALTGTIVERVSGMPWETFIRTRIFGPLGMTESIPLVAKTVGQPNVAVPHNRFGDSVRVVPVHSTDDIAPAGSVWSSVSDMSKWMRFILDSGRVGTKRLVTPATFSELVAPQIRAPMSEYPALTVSRPNFFSYALGWFVQDYEGETVWMHTGSIDGMCALIGLIPSRRMGVYILENLDHAELRHALMYKAFDLYNGRPARDWSAELMPLFARAGRGAQMAAGGRGAGGGRGGNAPAAAASGPSLPLDRYAGTYVDSLYGTVEVTLVDGKLRAKVVSDPVQDFQPTTYETFRAVGAEQASARQPSTLTFLPDGAGAISAVRASGVTFTRVRSGRGGGGGM